MLNRVLLIWSIAFSFAWASPFSAAVRTLSVESNAAVVEVTVSVPAGHVVYERSFSVASEEARVTAVRRAVAKKEPDPLDSAQEVAVFSAPFISVWRVERTPAAPAASFTVSWQGCSGDTCFLPESRLFAFDPKTSTYQEKNEEEPSEESKESEPWLNGRRLTATAGGYLNASEFQAFLDRAEGKETEVTFLRDPITFLREKGLWITLLLILAGGILLNLTPCVLPMIPVNLAIIGAVSRTQRSRSRGFLLGGVYGFGILFSYGLAGWFVVRGGAFFGSLQSSPWFSLAIAILFAVFALAMLDVLTIDLTRFRGGRRKPQGKKAETGIAAKCLAAFLAGAGSAILAGACVAPVVLAVLLLAGTLYAEGMTASQFLPFVLGLGMALPWPFAGMGLSCLPKPGMWMVWVKRVFAILLALLACYYGWLAVRGFRPEAVPSAATDGVAAGDRAAFRTALEAAGERPVLLDFWATWCKNCAVMERTTFRDPAVAQRLQSYAVIRVQAERPDEVREMLDEFGVKGLPSFAVLGE